MNRVAVKIEQMIIDVGVKEKPGSGVVAPEKKESRKPVGRPRMLAGVVYKIKPPIYDEALYVTITDHVVDGQRRPFEIFVMSKNMESFQWISILTRMISALMRQPHRQFPMFVIEEMMATFDPKGGYFGQAAAKGRFYPSVVAEIGQVLRERCIELGVDMGEEPVTYVAAEPVQEAEQEEAPMVGGVKSSSGTQCDKCQQFTVKMLDGCLTCLSCGDSKCN